MGCFRLNSIIFIFLIIIHPGGTYAGGRPESSQALSPSSNSEDSLHVLLMDNPWTDFIIERINDFEVQSNLSVTFEVLPEDQYLSLLILKMTSEINSPDIFILDAERDLNKFYYLNWLTDLSPYLQTESMERSPDFTKNFFKESLEVCKINDQYRAMPVLVLHEILAVNSSIMSAYGQSIPQDLEELKLSSEKINTNGNLTGILFRADNQSAIYPWLDILYSMGGEWKVPVKTGSNCYNKMLNAAEYYLDLLRKSTENSIIYNTVYENCAQFSKGKAGMIIEYNLYSSLLYAEHQKQDEIRFKSIPVGNKNHRILKTNQVIAISNLSSKKDCAWEFIVWATDLEKSISMLRKKIPTANETAWENSSPTFKKDSWLAVCSEEIRSSGSYFPIGSIRSAEIRKTFSSGLVEIYLREDKKIFDETIEKINKMSPFPPMVGNHNEN